MQYELFLHSIFKSVLLNFSFKFNYNKTWCMVQGIVFILPILMLAFPCFALDYSIFAKLQLQPKLSPAKGSLS